MFRGFLRLFIVGCSAEQSVSRSEVDVMVVTPAPSVAVSAALSSLPSSPQPAVEVAAPCATAFDDQLMLYVDVEVREQGVHPGWRELFLAHCKSMPTAFQRCASPLYQVDHEAECNAVKEESGTPAARQWSATFNVLQGAPGSLAKPPARKR